ncbi:MAG: tetratricopeptide repeat protein [Ferruginibacter sp.]
MSIKNLLTVLLLFACSFAKAQTIKNQSTFRMLKTATSLMEAQQFEAAEEYFKKGLANARTDNDVYCQAFAQEGLGNLYTKTDQTELAITAYRQAVKLYRGQGLTVIANIVESLLKSVQGVGDLYAGMEIGPKGVKMTVIEVKLSKDREYDYSLKADTAINTDAAALSYESEKQTHDAILLIYEIIKKRFQVSSDRIHIVISSGLKQELDRYNKVEYFANIVRPKELDGKIRINYVTANQEAELSFNGIVPHKNRFNTDQLDVGSGNTKGGYFNASKIFVPVTFPLGTKSFQRLIESKTNGDLDNYLKTAEQIMDDSLARLMVYEFANKKEFKSRDIVYLSGGIVWAVASFMHPQQISNNYVEISSQDIANFRKLVFSSYDKVTQPDVTLISNVDDARASLRNINRVMKTYDQKALLAGAIWLDELIQQVNSINPSKKFIYHRYAYVGWISGYIMEKIKKQYTGLVSR